MNQTLSPWDAQVSGTTWELEDIGEKGAEERGAAPVA